MILKNKNVAITGASSGIGLAITKKLLENGCKVVACARHIEKVDIKNAQNVICTPKVEHKK